MAFYSHVNYSVTKILLSSPKCEGVFYSHVNYSVTKISQRVEEKKKAFTVT